MNNIASRLMHIKRFKSNILSNERDVAIYLPPSYDKYKEKHYPVLYMQDGQNLFSEIKEGSKDKWMVKETVDKLIETEEIEEIIIVAIYNNEDRISEYTPSYMEKYKQGGRGKNYANFIADELKPYIDSNLRTLKDRDNTAIVGSSLGGLISFYIGWNYPDIFKKIGAMSPSFWWYSLEIIKEIENYKGERKDLSIWIDAGTAEEESDRNNNGIIDMVDDARDMVSILVEKGYTLDRDLMYYEVAGGQHNEEAWARRFDKVLLYMFGRK